MARFLRNFRYLGLCSHFLVVFRNPEYQSFVIMLNLDPAAVPMVKFCLVRDFPPLSHLDGLSCILDLRLLLFILERIVEKIIDVLIGSVNGEDTVCVWFNCGVDCISL